MTDLGLAAEQCLQISSSEGHDIDLLVLQPKTRISGGPVVLWLHGGGFCAGSSDCSYARLLAENTGITFVSVEYRLAPQWPFPAAMNDAFDALNWLAANSARFDVDPDRICVGGVGAGGGLAAGLCLLNRDRGQVAVAFQYLISPLLDNLHGTTSGRKDNDPLLSRQSSLDAWEMYLDGKPEMSASPYASPTRAHQVRGLPSTYVCVGQNELVRDETIRYAQKLMDAGVSVEISVRREKCESSQWEFAEKFANLGIHYDQIAALKNGLFRLKDLNRAFNDWVGIKSWDPSEDHT